VDASEPFSEPMWRGAEIATELRHEVTLIAEARFGRNGAKRQPRIPHELARPLQPEASNEIANRAPAAPMEFASDMHGVHVSSLGELSQRHTVDERVVNALFHTPKPRRTPAAGGDATAAGVAEEVAHDRVERAIGAAVVFVAFLNQAAPKNGNQFTVQAACGGEAAGLLGEAGHQPRRQFNLQTRGRDADGVGVSVPCGKQSHVTWYAQVIVAADRLGKCTGRDDGQQRELVRMRLESQAGRQTTGEDVAAGHVHLLDRRACERLPARGHGPF